MTNEKVAQNYRENKVKTGEFVGKAFSNHEEANKVAINKAFAHSNDYGFRVVEHLGRYLVIGKSKRK